MCKSSDHALPFRMDGRIHYHGTVGAQIEADAPATRYCDGTGRRNGLRTCVEGAVATGRDLRTHEPASAAMVPLAQEIEYGLTRVPVAGPVALIVRPHGQDCPGGCDGPDELGRRHDLLAVLGSRCAGRSQMFPAGAMVWKQH